MSEQETAVRVYGTGEYQDEGGKYHIVTRKVPAWVKNARRVCAGCHDNFYNGRANCDGNSHCWSLKPEYARRKTRPPCFH